MYAIRVDTEHRLLRAEFSGRLSREEALRAIAQGFALLDAGGLRGACCDARDVARGPGGLLLLASAVSFRYRAGMRIALIAEAEQLPIARRIVRYSGVPHAFRVFEEAEVAEEWLAEAGATRSDLHSTEQRHADHLIVISQPTRPRTAVASDSRTGPAA